METKRRWPVARAKAEWNKMKADPCVERDFKGMEEEFRLRLAVPIGDFISMSASTMEQKAVARVFSPGMKQI
eukprot:9359029-Lingulodinium_polyedra.AAC.1